MTEVIKYLNDEIPVGWYREIYAKLYPDPTVLEQKVQEKVETTKRQIKQIHQRFVVNQGFSLSFYSKERQLFPEAFTTKVSDEEATKIFRKLLRHFLPKSYMAKHAAIRFYGNHQSGSAGYGRVRVSHNPSIGLLCHEIGHLIHLRHDKHLMGWIKRFTTYCKKKNYWRNN